MMWASVETFFFAQLSYKRSADISYRESLKWQIIEFLGLKTKFWINDMKALIPIN